MINSITWMLSLIPVAWVMIGRRIAGERYARSTVIGFVAFCAAWATFALVSSHDRTAALARNPAIANPYWIGYNLIMPIFVGPGWHDGPLFFGRILPVSLALYPFVLYLPTVAMLKARAQPTVIVQTLLFALHSAWTGLMIIAMEMD